MDIPKKVKEAISHDKLVIFVGAGLSKKFQLPSWVDLVKDVLVKINDSKYSGLLSVMENEIMTPIEVLEKLKSEHNEIKKYIKSNFQIHTGDLSLHKKILSLTGKIITTNYDNAFELASENKIIPATYTSDFNISEISKTDESYIFKIHGSFNEPDNCIVFRDQYDKLYLNDTSATQKLKSIFTEKTILFIGFSFNDPDINEIFSNLDKTFGNNNKHYILTTQPENFKQFNFLEAIQISDFSQIENFIDSGIQCKNKSSNVEENTEVIVDINKTPRIAILVPQPIELNFEFEIDKILDCFNSVSAELYVGVLNLKTLTNLEDFDLIVVISKVFKSHIYIEEDNLKSSLLTPIELLSNIPNDNIPVVFITDEKIDPILGYSIINICSYKTSTIKKFIFKALREGKLDFVEQDIIISLDKPLAINCLKGVPTVNSLYHHISRDLDIGKKALTSVIGRIEEQSALALKILSLIKSNKFLNIKASGGTGKTTLIKKVAYELYNRGYFRQGVTFHSCENVKSYDDFEDIITRGFNLSNIINFKDYLQENFSYVKNDILIILDNFETVVNNLNVVDFDKVINLLTFVTDYANIVITSRERLTDSEDIEDIYSLTPLITEDAQKLFTLYYGEIKSKEEIKILRSEILEDLLNNNPLAIKLVTKSRTRSIHISELRDQLKEHFFESTNEDYSAVFKNNSDLNIERTKSIFQSINYSYTTLKSREKIVFELLSLFPDGIGLSNFKKCFERKNSKNEISDRELRILKDKSLVEDYNGTLQLQPIIRRFADYQFNKRPVDIKNRYCTDAYLYNGYILELIEYVNNRGRNSAALKIFNNNKNNLYKVLEYIPNIQISDNTVLDNKKYFLNYINDMVDYILNEREINELYKYLRELKPYFADVPKADVFLNVIENCTTYYFEEFDKSYSFLTKTLPPQNMLARVFKDEISIETKYLDRISNIHSMEGYTLLYIESFMINNDPKMLFNNDLFYLGVPSIISKHQKGFYYFEIEHMFGRLNVDRLESYILSLHPEQHLEIMQSTYTLSKVKKLASKDIQKLVVTNPYTKGLKQLMEALISEDVVAKEVLFNKALKNLYHIKYYYLEALYYFINFLEKIKSPAFDEKLEHGLSLAREFKYQYLDFLFTNLKIKDNSSKYDFSYSYYGNEDFESFINKHSQTWIKYYNDNKIFEN